MKKRWFLLAQMIAVWLWLIAPVGIAQAHANLVTSNPSAGQSLAQFPTTAQLQFSEAVNTANPSAVLFDASGVQVAVGTITPAPNDPRTINITFPAQPNGVYSIGWQVQSAVDGHITSGTIAFSCGPNAPKVSLLPPLDTPDPAALLPAAWEVILRWVGYLALSLALGGALFYVAVWWPAYRASLHPTLAGNTLLNWDGRLAQVMRRFVIVGAIAVTVSLIGITLGQGLETAGSMGMGMQDPLWLRIVEAFGHHQGGLLWPRLLVLLLMAVLATLLRPAGSGIKGAWGPTDTWNPARPWWEIVGLGVILLATYSLGGHNAALGSPLPIIGDFLHLAGMVSWIGGLVPLGLLLLWQWQAKSPTINTLVSQVTRRFSRLATIAVAVIGLSGLYSALLQIRTLAALTGTRYGQAVLIKTGLFLLLLALGAVNQFGLIPRLTRAGLRSLLHLADSVRVEWGLGLLLLLAVGGLMSLSPGYQALQAEYRQGYQDAVQISQTRLDFRAAPGQVGDNELGVDVVDRRPGADQVQPTVLFRIQLVDGSTGQTQVQAQPAPGAAPSGGRWTARGSYFSRMGVWQVLVIWRKAGFDDVTYTFNVDLAQIAANRGEKINPVPASAASVDDGHTLYLTNCAPCHGISGKGDGPAGQSLIPPPADLTQHVIPGVHTDGQLFDWISSGFPGSAMPAFKDNLTEKQRWDILNYIRTLGK